MTKFRTLFAVFSSVVAAASVAATRAAAHGYVDSADLPYVAGHGNPSSPQNDLPAPPKFAGTQKGPSLQKNSGTPQVNPGQPNLAATPGTPRAAQIRTQPLWGVRYGRF